MSNATTTRHSVVDDIARELEIIHSIIQLSVDTLAHHSIVEVDHARLALQFAADKAWENLCNAQALAAQLLAEACAEMQGGEG